MDTTITDVVYLDVGVCPDGVRADRSLGDKAICTSTQPLGRIIIGERRRSNFSASQKPEETCSQADIVAGLQSGMRHCFR